MPFLSQPGSESDMATWLIRLQPVASPDLVPVCAELGELVAQRIVGARIRAFAAQNAFWVIKLLPRQCQDSDLHWAGCFAVWAFAAFHRVSLHAQEAVLLEWSHFGSDWAQIPAPESWDLVCAKEECEQNYQSGVDHDRN